MQRVLALAGIALVVGAGGCRSPEPARAGAVDVPSLTPELAWKIIEGSSAFRIEESTVHVLEWKMDFGEKAGLWAIRRNPAGDRTRVTVEVLDGAKDWLERAEYYSGGIVPMHLRQPISRRVVEVVEIVDAAFPQMKEVQFRWAYSESPAVLAQLKPELVGGPYLGRARIQFQEDSWKLVGHIRDSRMEL